MYDEMAEHMECLRMGEASRFKRHIHAVIFFINAATVGTDDEEEMKVVKKSCLKVQLAFVLWSCCSCHSMWQCSITAQATCAQWLL